MSRRSSSQTLPPCSSGDAPPRCSKACPRVSPGHPPGGTWGRAHRQEWFFLSANSDEDLFYGIFMVAYMYSIFIVYGHGQIYCVHVHFQGWADMNIFFQPIPDIYLADIDILKIDSHCFTE